MKTGYVVLSAAAIIPLLSSCASYEKTADNEAWRIKPILSVRNSIETPEGFYQLGRYYQGQKRYAQALAAYQKALAIDNTFADAHNGLGVVYAMQGNQQQALEQFRLAAQQAPNAAHILNNLGYAQYLSGAYAEAVNTLEQALVLDSSNQTAHTNLALALAKAGDREKAMQVMAEVAMPQSAGNAPPVTQEVQRAQTGTLTSVPSPVAVTISAPVPPQMLALPKEWGVIKQAEWKQVPQVESRSQVVQLAPNVYELRERPEVQVQAKAGQQVQGAITVAKPYRIEVSNGNGVAGMARKVAGYLNGEGYSGARLTNQKPFQVTMSQVQYRPGYQKQAQSLALTLPGQPGVAQADTLRADISIKLVLGKDMADKVAYFEQGKIHLVRFGSGF